MNLYDYLDKVNKRAHLRRIIKLFDSRLFYARQYLMQEKNSNQIKEAKITLSIIEEIKAEQDFYQKKLDELL